MASITLVLFGDDVKKQLYLDVDPKKNKVIEVKEWLAKEIGVKASDLLLSCKHEPITVRRGVQGVTKMDLDGKEDQTLFETGIDTDGEYIFYEDFLRDTLPRELIDLIVSSMSNATKRVIRSTNKYWFGYIRFDQFKIFFAHPKMLPDLTQHLMRFYGDKPIGVSLRKMINSKTTEYRIDQLAQLTNLTSLEFDFSEDLSNVKSVTALYNLTNLVHLSPNINPTSCLTNLTSLTVKPDSLSLMPLYTNLQHFALSSYNRPMHPFAVVSNPSKLTSLKIQSSNEQWPDISDNLTCQFENVKFLAIQYTNNGYGRLSKCLQYMTALEHLNLNNYLPRDDIFTLTTLTKLRLGFDTIDNFDYQKLSSLTNLKSLVTVTSIEQDYSFLTSLLALEKVSFHIFEEARLLDVLKYLRSTQLTSLTIYDMNEAFNLDYLSNLTSLLKLALHETSFHVHKCYDALLNLTNLTKFHLSSKCMDSNYLTVLSHLTTLMELDLFDFSMTPTTTSDYITLRSLTNLHALGLVLTSSETTFNDLIYLTKLTSLQIDMLNDIPNNLSTLNSLTLLKKLIVENQTFSQQLWNWLTCLSELEFLRFSCGNSEDVLESLSILTNLTDLTVFHSVSVNSSCLTKLTNIQRIYLKPIAKGCRYNSSEDLSEKLTRLYNLAFE